jgi:hypothetical protein
MKKLYFLIFLSFVFLALVNKSFAQREPFYGPWGDSPGGNLHPVVKFSLTFLDDRCGWNCMDNEYTGSIIYKEYGNYISKNDSLYITINESNVPNSLERIGLTFGIKFIFSADYPHEIRFTNAKLLTNGWSKEDTLKMVRMVTSVKNSKWSEIKNKFKNP